ncbi:MAG: histidinol-phosphate transaminase [Synergistaceae bacterium]|jgi:histidinol-phosphate aminotransferase|nr:histidinol-phosphate transaminase [Synergistaceae bacterium]
MAVAFKEYLRGLEPYTPAPSIEAIKRKYGLPGVVKLAGNENNHGPSPRIAEALIDAQRELSCYPDMSVGLLGEAIADRHGVRVEEIAFGNGSFSLISLIAQIFLAPGDEAIIPSPSFNWYRVASMSAGAAPASVPLKQDKIDLDGILRRITPKTKVIWICNPNNPTGGLIESGELADFLKKTPDGVLVVLDEAYIDYVTEGSAPRSPELIRKHPNIIALRTFSKVYSLASMRVGYALASEENARMMRRVQQPPAVSTYAQMAALAAFSDLDHYRYVVSENKRGREQYYSGLASLSCAYVPTQANFILFDTGLDSDETKEKYARGGVLLRAGSEFGYPTRLRVTIGRPEENQLVLEMLKGFMRK